MGEGGGRPAHSSLEGSVESLNVAVTAGVILFEAMRQRRKNR